MRSEAAIDADITRLQSQLDDRRDRIDTLFAIADALAERANVFDAGPRPGSCGRNQARIDAVNAYVRLSEELKRTRDVRLFIAAYYGSLEMELDGRSDWAASEYRLVLHYGPPDLQPFAAFGLAELEWRELDAAEEALTDFKRVLEFQHNELIPYALLRLAELNQRRGDMETAAMWRGRLLHEFPDSAAAKL